MNRKGKAFRVILNIIEIVNSACFLVTCLKLKNYRFTQKNITKIIVGFLFQIGQHITVNDVKCLNLATHNYLGLVNNEVIEDKAVAAVQKYGIGSCGPRGFFGTVGKNSLY